MRGRLANSIAILLNYGGRSRIIYYLFFVICLDYELSILFDNRLQKILFKHRKQHIQFLKNSPIYYSLESAIEGNAYSTSFFGLFGYSNILSYLSLARNQILALLVYMLLIVGFLYMIADLFLFKHRNKSPRSSWLNGLYAIVLFNFDYFSLAIFEYFINCITCLPDYYDERFEAQAASNTSIGISTVIDCYGTTHIYVILGALMTSVPLVLLVYVTQKLKNMVDFSCLQSKHGMYDFYHMMILLGVILFKQFVLAFGSSTPSHMTSFYVFLGIALNFDMLLLLFNPTFYNASFERLIDFKSLAVYLSGLLLLKDELIFRQMVSHVEVWDFKEYYSAIGLGLLMPLLLRLVFLLKYRNRSMGFQLSRNKRDSGKIMFLASIFHSFYDQPSNLRAKSRLMTVLFDFKIRNRYMLLEFPELRTKIDQVFSLGNSREFEQMRRSKSRLFFGIKFKNAKDNLFHPSRKSFLDSFKKGQNKMLRIVLEILSKLLKIEIGKWDMTSIHQAPAFLLSMYIWTLIEVEGKIAAAATFQLALKQACKGSSIFTQLKVDLLGEIVKNKIELLNKHNTLFIPRQRKDIEMDIPHQRSLDFSREVCLWNEFSSLISLLQSCIQIKRALVEQSVLKGFDVDQLMALSRDFRIKDKAIERLISSISEMYLREATVFKLLKVFYYMHVSFNMKLARSNLRLLYHHHYQELMEEFFRFRSYSHEITTLVVSAEPETFHSITYCSSNILNLVAFSSSELLGNDLALLLPEPLVEDHRSFMNPENNTGMLLEYDFEFTCLMKTKEETVRPVALFVRLNPSFEKGLQYIGNLKQSGKGSEKAPFIVASENCEILEVSQDASSKFRPGDYLGWYSRNLAERLKGFGELCRNKIAEFKQLKDHLSDDEKLNTLKMNKEYLKNTERVCYQIRNRTFSKENITFRMRDIMIERSQNLFFILKYYDQDLVTEEEIKYANTVSSSLSFRNRTASPTRTPFAGFYSHTPTFTSAEAHGATSGGFSQFSSIVHKKLRVHEIIHENELKILKEAFELIQTTANCKSNRSRPSSNSKEALTLILSEKSLRLLSARSKEEEEGMTDVSDIKYHAMYNELTTGQRYTTKFKSWLIAIFLMSFLLVGLSLNLSYRYFTYLLRSQCSLEEVPSLFGSLIKMSSNTVRSTYLISMNRLVNEGILENSAFASHGAPSITNSIKHILHKKKGTSLLRSLQDLNPKLVALNGKGIESIVDLYTRNKLMMYDWHPKNRTYDTFLTSAPIFKSLQKMVYAHNIILRRESPQLTEEELNKLKDFYEINATNAVLKLITKVMNGLISHIKSVGRELSLMVAFQTSARSIITCVLVLCFGVFLICLQRVIGKIVKKCFCFKKDTLNHEIECYKLISIKLRKIIRETPLVQKNAFPFFLGMNVSLIVQKSGSLSVEQLSSRRRPPSSNLLKTTYVAEGSYLLTNRRPEMVKVTSGSYNIGISKLLLKYLCLLLPFFLTEFFIYLSAAYNTNLVFRSVEVLSVVNYFWLVNIKISTALFRLADPSFSQSLPNQIEYHPVIPYATSLVHEVKEELLPQMVAFRLKNMAEMNSQLEHILFKRNICTFTPRKKWNVKIPCQKSTISFIHSRAEALKLVIEAAKRDRVPGHAELKAIFKEATVWDFAGRMLGSRPPFKEVSHLLSNAYKDMIKKYFSQERFQWFASFFHKVALPMFVISSLGVYFWVYKTALALVLDFMNIFKLMSVSLFRSNPELIRYANKYRRINTSGI